MSLTGNGNFTLNLFDEFWIANPSDHPGTLPIRKRILEHKGYLPKLLDLKLASGMLLILTFNISIFLRTRSHFSDHFSEKN